MVHGSRALGWFNPLFFEPVGTSPHPAIWLRQVGLLSSQSEPWVDATCSFKIEHPGCEENQALANHQCSVEHVFLHALVKYTIQLALQNTFSYTRYNRVDWALHAGGSVAGSASWQEARVAVVVVAFVSPLSEHVSPEQPGGAQLAGWSCIELQPVAGSWQMGLHWIATRTCLGSSSAIRVGRRISVLTRGFVGGSAFPSTPMVLKVGALHVVLALVLRRVAVVGTVFHRRCGGRDVPAFKRAWGRPPGGPEDQPSLQKWTSLLDNQWTSLFDQNNESANLALPSKTHQVDQYIGLWTFGPDRLDPKESSSGR